MLLHHHLHKTQSVNIDQIYQLYEFPFEAIFDVPEAKEEFRQYLKKEHNEEPFLFYEDVEEYKRLKFEENKAKKAIAIFKNYLLPNSPHEVNISAQHRQNAIKAFEQSAQLQNDKSMLVPENVFDEIQLAIFYNLKNDNYPRFTVSQQFKNFLKQKDIAFVSLIAIKKNTTYMKYVPKLEGLICDRDIQFFSFMCFNDDLEVWDEISVSKDARAACYQSKKEFYFNDQLGQSENMSGKIMKMKFILPCTKEEAFNVFSHTHLRKEILDIESINQVDYIPISKNNKYAQTILHTQMPVKGFSWIMKPREAVAAVTCVYDTKRESYGFIMKSTETMIVPIRKSHVRVRVLTSAFFSDCPVSAKITSHKILKKQSESSPSLKKSLNSHKKSSSQSSFSLTGVVTTLSERVSRHSEEDASEDQTMSPSESSFGSAEHACLISFTSFLDFKIPSETVKKKIFKTKNKIIYNRLLNTIKESRAMAFPRAKFSEGVLDTLDAFKEYYLSNDPNAEMTWELEDEEDGTLHEIVSSTNNNNNNNQH
ncbi:hypothetical protein FDP41_008184 [Naegleria fowleri]|uniref:RGS domain-containing protein n=1 Tax=Naegleria fowleri TaxID=5763 RepID=A0A6A5BHJ3_NAEFO|nr:uncharacterized protein FDP41_008184 [Naegleria fowleri]KAF0973480.1 hypothetical protein FDP41_008184 [Naegleria fowleri]